MVGGKSRGQNKNPAGQQMVSRNKHKKRKKKEEEDAGPFREGFRW
jgi:hypothetical protein